MTGMRLFRTGRPTLPEVLELDLPRLDGTGWPDEAVVGRRSFESATWSELGLRSAYDPQAHAVADLLADELLPHVPLEVAAEDEPYLRKVLSVAARQGAGLALVERGRAGAVGPAADRRLVGALWQARRGLPAMRPDWSAAAAFLLLAGFHVARTPQADVPRVLAALRRGAR
jgi:hypothetical protein